MIMWLLKLKEKLFCNHGIHMTHLCPYNAPGAPCLDDKKDVHHCFWCFKFIKKERSYFSSIRVWYVGAEKKWSVTNVKFIKGEKYDD